MLPQPPKKKTAKTPTRPTWLDHLFLMLPPPRSTIEYWEDDDSASVTWTPTMLGRLFGQRSYIRMFRRVDGELWIDAETGEVPNRWLHERIETKRSEALRERGRS